MLSFICLTIYCICYYYRDRLERERIDIHIVFVCTDDNDDVDDDSYNKCIQ